jgi:hypothetical protein
MAKAKWAVVRGGRIETDALPEWPDGTEVRIELECRPGLTADDTPLSSTEVGVIMDQIVRTEKEEQP